MNMTAIFHKPWKLAAAAFPALILAVVIKAYALPTQEVEITYFNDAAHTNIVGYLIHGCNGQTSRSGRTSRFRETIRTQCDTGPKPPPPPSAPCEFSPKGCGFFPNRNGH